MTAVAYSEWLPCIQPHVPDCPTPMITDMVRSVCIDFCESSRYLRTQLDSFNTVVDDDEYEITTPTDTVLAGILSMRVGDRVLEATTQERLEEEATYWRDRSGPPTRYIQSSEQAVILNPVPSDVEAVRVFAAIRPSQASGGIDEAIFERFRDGIASGAISRLMAMPGVAWSNPQLAEYHASIYGASVTQASSKAARGLTHDVRPRIRPRYL